MYLIVLDLGLEIQGFVLIYKQQNESFRQGFMLHRHLGWTLRSVLVSIKALYLALGLLTYLIVLDLGLEI